MVAKKKPPRKKRVRRRTFIGFQVKGKRPKTIVDTPRHFGAGGTVPLDG